MHNNLNLYCLFIDIKVTRVTLLQQLHNKYLTIGKLLLLNKREIIIKIRIELKYIINRFPLLSHIIYQIYSNVFKKINLYYETYWDVLLAQMYEIECFIKIIFGSYYQKIIFQQNIDIQKLFINQVAIKHYKYHEIIHKWNNHQEYIKYLDQINVQSSCIIERLSLKLFEIDQNLHALKYYNCNKFNILRQILPQCSNLAINLITRGLGYDPCYITREQCINLTHIYQILYFKLNNIIQMQFINNKKAVETIRMLSLSDIQAKKYKEVSICGDIDKYTQMKHVTLDLNLMFGFISCPYLFHLINNMKVVQNLKFIYSKIYGVNKKLMLVSCGFLQNEFGNKKKKWNQKRQQIFCNYTKLPKIITILIAISNQYCYQNKTNGSTMFALNSNHHHSNVDPFCDLIVIQPILKSGDVLVFGDNLLYCEGNNDLESTKMKMSIICYGVLHLMSVKNKNKYGEFDSHLKYIDRECHFMKLNHMQILFDSNLQQWTCTDK